MKLRVLVLVTAACSLLGSLAQAAGTLVAGPLLGYRAHREVFIWVETKNAQQVTLEYWLAGKPGTKLTLGKSNLETTPAGGQISQFRPGLLEMGAAYEYSLSIDGQKQAFAYPLRFSTTAQWEWRAPPPDFKFLFGTCAYFNEPVYDRPGEGYGKTMETFRHMADSGADFMIWGGDNWYFREADFSSVSGLWYRAQRDRSLPELQKLWAVMHHYATWDDHDYGSNDTNKSFAFKGESLQIFRSYWGNPSYGEPDNPGVYTRFTWGDAAFVVLDNRYHRDDTTLRQDITPDKSQYGAQQRDWLKQTLLQLKVLGHYPFKFVVTGGQVITDFGGWSETFDHFRHEREEILKFIRDEKITGVIFLSGDVHFTELAKMKLNDSQWVYELTSSPLSSGVDARAGTDRASDPHRVEGTQVVDQNYCTLAIHGEANARILTIACFDKTGAKRWERDISPGELK